MTIIECVSNQKISSNINQIVNIYRKAFSIPPYSKSDGEVEEFVRSLPDHVRREGFRFVIGRDTDSHKWVGFAYGYTSVPGNWWHDELVERIEPYIVEKWFDNSFQLVEIAVTPEAQGLGIGGRIHDNLLNDIPHKKAVLTTLQEQTAAYQLYKNRGWEILLGDLRFPGIRRIYQMMGLDLTKARIEGAG